MRCNHFFCTFVNCWTFFSRHSRAILTLIANFFNRNCTAYTLCLSTYYRLTRINSIKLFIWWRKKLLKENEQFSLCSFFLGKITEKWKKIERAKNSWFFKNSTANIEGYAKFGSSLLTLYTSKIREKKKFCLSRAASNRSLYRAVQSVLKITW